jgi:hypothetical protein
MKFKNSKSLDKLTHQTPPKSAVARVEKQKNNTSYVLGKFLKSRSKLPIKNPPANSSKKTLKDAQNVLKTMQTAPELFVKFSKAIDPNKPHYQMWANFANSVTGEKYNEEWFRKIIRQTDSFIDYVKLQYKRLRPFQLGPAIGVNIKKTVTDPLTAGYPSAHTFEAYVFARILSQLHPQHAQAFEEVAETVAVSRVVVGVHFYDDLEAGKKLAEFVVRKSWIDVPE